MNAIEFRALQAAADFIDIGTADYLGVDIADVLDWQDGTRPPPAWAVERLRARVAELAGPPHGYQPTDNRPEPRYPPTDGPGVSDRRNERE